MSIKKRVFLFFFKILSIVIFFFISLSFAQVNRDFASLSLKEAKQRVIKLKKSLATAKGDKRGKIIKKIARLENKILEQHLSSFRKAH